MSTSSCSSENLGVSPNPEVSRLEIRTPSHVWFLESSWYKWKEILSMSNFHISGGRNDLWKKRSGWWWLVVFQFPFESCFHWTSDLTMECKGSVLAEEISFLGHLTWMLHESGYKNWLEDLSFLKKGIDPANSSQKLTNGLGMLDVTIQL